MADLTLRQVKKSYGNVHILHGIDLDIRSGEFIVFVGPSGCGKSTLLRAIAGLEEITGGELSIGGRVVNEVPPAERGIAMVFQSYALYPHMNLFDNMAFGLKLARVPKDEIETAVRHAARILHIEHLLDRKPKDLSGGQRQRVALARAIAVRPRVLLLDDPLSALDVTTEAEVTTRLREELAGTTTLVVAHRPSTVALADRVAVLEDGRITGVGTHTELLATHAHYRYVLTALESDEETARRGADRPADLPVDHEDEVLAADEVADETAEVVR